MPHDSTPINVLHVYPCLEDGGLEMMIANIVKALPAPDYRHWVLTCRKGSTAMEERLEKYGCRVRRLDPVGDIRPSPREYRRRVKDFLKAADYAGITYDVVHIHHHPHMEQAALAARWAGVKVRILHSHNCRQDASPTRRTLTRLAYRRHIRGATHLLGCSQEALDWLFPYKGKAQALVMQNGIDTSRFNYDPEVRALARERICREYGIPEKDACIVLNAGRCAAQKNQKFLIEVAQQAKRFQKEAHRVIFIIAGDGPEREPLEKKARELGLDNIHFIGHTEEMHELLCAADVLMLPSIFEGASVVAVEAQACGLPVVVSEAVPRCVDAGVDLFSMLPLDSPFDWYIETYHAESWNQKRRVRISERFRSDTLLEQFTLKGMAASLSKVYRAGQPEAEPSPRGKVLIVPHPLPPSGRTGGDRVDRMIVRAAESKWMVKEWSMLPDRSWDSLSKWEKMRLRHSLTREGLRLQKEYEALGYETLWLFNTSKCLYTSRLAEALGKRGVNTFSITHHPLYLQMEGRQRRIYRAQELGMLTHIKHPIAPSEFTRRLLQTDTGRADISLLEIPFERVSEPADGLTDSWSEYVEGRFMADTRLDFRLIFIGSVERRKGVHHLLEAMHILKEQGAPVRLNVIGCHPDTSYLKDLKRMVEKWDLNVVFEGYLPDFEKRGLLGVSHALVLPSMMEGYGMVLVEAMAHGVPVIGCRCGGMVDIIGENEERGLLAAPEDSASLAECIRDLMIYPPMRKILIEKAFEYVASRPDMEAFSRRCLSILDLPAEVEVDDPESERK